ncbi:MAG: hypothetical protein ACI81T_004029 [Bacteroidia bacterium]|jgi:hypothetical protein
MIQINTTMLRETDKYYLNQEEPNKSCLLALREIILEKNQNITESKKWNIPCFSYKKKLFCFLNIDKETNSPYMLVVEGNRVHHPELEQGNRSRMRILRINPNEDIQIEEVDLLLDEMLALYES